MPSILPIASSSPGIGLRGPHLSAGTPRVSFRARIAFGVEWVDRFPASLLGLIIRAGIADVFWRSGQTKVDGWHVTESAVQLFRDEYKVPLLTPAFAATLAAVQEHLFSVLLIDCFMSSPAAREPGRSTNPFGDVPGWGFE